MSTLHTVNAPQTVERILSFYAAEQHGQVRQRLSENLAGVLSQRLIPRAGGKGLLPAFELMLSTPHIRELLAEGNIGEMARVIEQGTELGRGSSAEGTPAGRGEVARGTRSRRRRHPKGRGPRPPGGRAAPLLPRWRARKGHPALPATELDRQAAPAAGGGAERGRRRKAAG